MPHLRTLLPTCVLLGCAMLPVAVWGKSPCDPNVTPQKFLGYQERGGGERARCEGMYIAQISGAPLQVVSFTRGVWPPLANDVGPLRLKPTADGSASGPSIRIEAQSLDRRIYYRLDAEVPSGKALEWPFDEVVLQPGGPGRQVGVLGYFETERGMRTLVPLNVEGNQGPTHLVLRPGLDLEDVRWRSRSDDGQDVFGASRLAARRVFDGESIDVDLTAEAAGRRVVEVSGHLPGSARSYALQITILR